MGRLIKKWGKGKYGIWTTIGDGYIHEPKKITKKEAISFIASEWREDLKKRIKGRFSYPEIPEYCF